MDDVFGVVPQRSLLNPRSSRFSPMLLSRSFIILQFTLMFFIHFELISVKSNLCLEYVFLHVGVQLFQLVFNFICKEIIFTDFYSIVLKSTLTKQALESCFSKYSFGIS